MSRYGAASTSSGTRASAASHLRRISDASVSSKAKLTARVSGRPTDSAQFRARIEAAFAPETKIRTASGRPSALSSTVGTSATTTPGSVRSRSLSANSNGCRASSASARRRNCSGTTTVTKSDSPRGRRQTWSSTASTVPPCGSSVSSFGAPSARWNQRGPIPGSLPRRGTWIARNPSGAIVRAKASARSAAGSRSSTTSSVRLRAPGAAATAAAPALNRRPTRA